MHRTTPRPRAGRGRSGLTLGAASLLIASLLGSGGMPSFAKDLDDYATWDDVVAAQNDIDRQNELIAEIKAQIEDLNNQVTEAEAAAEQASQTYASAQVASTTQSEKTYDLQQQVDEANEAAETAEAQAANYIAAVSNRVPVDPTVELLTTPGDAEDFLMGMSTLSKLGSQNGAVYEQAVAARNNADQLTEQANVALEELQRLETEAEANYDAAVEAQLNLQEKRDQKTEKGSELEAMLIPLQEHRDVVEADYQEGERLRQEEEARKAAEAAAAAANGSGYTPSSSNSEGTPSHSGYYPPLGYSVYVTSSYGMRLHPVYGYWKFHNGTDYVTTFGTCGAPIYAVASGTVTLAAYVDGWGNRVDYQLDDGTLLGNAHIMEGGILVYPGQRVTAGQVIAYAGTTGPSTGCHLHFMVNDGAVDPEVWLAQRL